MKTMFCYGGITSRKEKDAYYYGRNYFSRSISPMKDTPVKGATK